MKYPLSLYVGIAMTVIGFLFLLLFAPGLLFLGIIGFVVFFILGWITDPRNDNERDDYNNYDR